MKQLRPQICFCRGQALTEVLISMLVFAPMILIIPVIGKYIDVKQKTIEASRYAVWERSVWADPENSWNSGEQQKSNEDIALEVDRRFFGHLSQRIADKSAYPYKGSVVNPMWNTINTKPKKSLNNSNNTATDAYQPILNGVNGNSKTLRAYTKMTAADMPVSLLGIDQVASLMDIKVKDYIIATVSTPIKNHSLSDDNLVIQAKSALLTNTWSVPSKKEFTKRVDDLVLGDEVNDLIIKVTGNVISLGGAIAIGLYYPDLYFLNAPKIRFLKTDVEVDSTDLPKHLLREKDAENENKSVRTETEKKEKKIKNTLNTYDNNFVEENLLANNKDSKSAKEKNTTNDNSNNDTDINAAINAFSFLLGEDSNSNTQSTYVSGDNNYDFEKYQNDLNNLDFSDLSTSLTIPAEIDMDSIKQQVDGIVGSYGGENIGCSEIFSKSQEGQNEIDDIEGSLGFFEKIIFKIGKKIVSKLLKPLSLSLGGGGPKFNCD